MARENHLPHDFVWLVVLRNDREARIEVNTEWSLEAAMECAKYKVETLREIDEIDDSEAEEADEVFDEGTLGFQMNGWYLEIYQQEVGNRDDTFEL